MTTRVRRLRDPLAVGVAALLASAYVAVVDPNQPGHYPLCPTKAFTGLDCPGCGGLRAVHDLLHGDLVGALDHNAFAVLVLLPGAAVFLVRWAVTAWRAGGPDGEGAPVPAPVPRPTVLWSVLALAVVFTLVRNVSAVPDLAWLGSSTS